MFDTKGHGCFTCKFAKGLNPVFNYENENYRRMKVFCKLQKKELSEVYDGCEYWKGYNDPLNRKQ